MSVSVTGFCCSLLPSVVGTGSERACTDSQNFVCRIEEWPLLIRNRKKTTLWIVYIFINKHINKKNYQKFERSLVCDENNIGMRVWPRQTVAQTWISVWFSEFNTLLGHSVSLVLKLFSVFTHIRNIKCNSEPQSATVSETALYNKCPEMCQHSSHSDSSTHWHKW